MASRSALCLCIGFILYLLYTDSKHNNVSIYLWIPLIWVIIIASRLPAYWFNPEAIQGTAAEMDLEGNIYNRLILSFLMLLGLIVLVKRKFPISEFIKDNKWIFLFYVYCAVSIAWSDFHWVSFKRYIKEIGSIIMIVTVLTENNSKEAIKTIFRRCAYVLIPLSVVLIKYFPKIGRGYHRYTDLAIYNGAAIGKNSLSLLCLISSLYFIFELQSNWKYGILLTDKKKLLLNTVMLLLTLWLLKKADSSTANICLILGIVNMVFLYIFKDEHYEKIILIFFVILAPILAINFNSFLTSAVSLTDSSETFWGRVENWPVFIDLMNSSPFIGVGYNSFWLGDRIEQLSKIFWWRPTEAHNGYVGIYLELGILGLILISGIIVSTYINNKERLKSNLEYGMMSMTFLIVALAYNITEEAFKGLHYMWFVFLLFAVKLPQKNY